MTAVRTTTEEFPELAELLRSRRERGQDTYDEWWNGEYRTVTGPTPEHGRLLVALGVFLHPLVQRRGLHMSAPVNIGVDKADCRVPDLGVYEPDTPRTSPAFLATALLVVEALSPGETPGAKLDFYFRAGVQEYLEIDLMTYTVKLFQATDLGWSRSLSSSVLGFDVGVAELVAGDDIFDVPGLFH